MLPVIKNINVAAIVNLMALSPLKEHYLMFTARGKLKPYDIPAVQVIQNPPLFPTLPGNPGDLDLLSLPSVHLCLESQQVLAVL